MDLPALNLLSATALAGLSYRALGEGAPGSDAPLTRRKLENTGVERTELALSVSAGKADVEIAMQKAAAHRENATQAGLDLRIFNDEYPPPEPSRGLFGKRRTAADKEAEAKRQELEELAKLAHSELQDASARAAHLEKQLKQDMERIESIEAGRFRLHGEIRSQLASLVLEAVAAGEIKQAEEQLGIHRNLIRGDLMIGVLLVVVRLLIDGPDAAKQELVECRLIFDQHSQAAPRVLESLIAVAQGSRLSRQQLGLMLKEQFEFPAMFNLYQLVLALDGWALDDNGLKGNPFFPTLWAVRQYSGSREESSGFEACPPDELARWAVQGGLIVRTIAVHILLSRGDNQLAFAAAGIPPEALQPPAKGKAVIDLKDILTRIDCVAWPQALIEPWRTALACHVLLAANGNVPQPLFDCWLEESYGWPKSDLYWWVLATIKQDKALLSNITRNEGGLFVAAGI